MSTIKSTTKKSALEQFADASVQRAAARARLARLEELDQEDLMDELSSLPLDVEWEGLDEALEDLRFVRAQAQLRGVA